MKETYISLLERVMEAYSYDDIQNYYKRVCENGITEHGFPRLTANIGILIANGRKHNLYNMFIKMMDLCCNEFLKPAKYGVGNDFSVKEIIFCIIELEKSKAVPKEKTNSWRDLLSKIEYEKCYNVFAKSEEDCCANWALFTAVSEFMRNYIGLSDTKDFVDLQISTQLKRLDENMMYRDGDFKKSNPIVYDAVPRKLFSILIHLGYNGKYKEQIDKCLKKAGLFTLEMQSVNGEMAFGGRSNQFLHNEAQIAAILEFEANRYYEEGNYELAGQFKSGAIKALRNIEKWLSREKVTHVKNNFPIESGVGCEFYAHFDKYMTTTASFLYVAYMFCNENIAPVDTADAPKAFSLSKSFNKTFLKNKSWMVEIDEDADTDYDASGIGRIHFNDAPSSICLSVPGTATPEYKSNLENNIDFSIAPGVCSENDIIFAHRGNAEYVLKKKKTTQKSAFAKYKCNFKNWKNAEFSCQLNENDILVNVKGKGDVFLMLPAFSFDGKVYTNIEAHGNSLEIHYDGYICRYISDGEITYMNKKGFNRNGEYEIFFAKGRNKVSVRIEIERI